MAPGVEVVLEVVQIAVNEQFPSLMPTLYPGGLATVSKPFGILDAMWLAFETLATNMTCHQRRNNFFFVCFFDECVVIRPVVAPARW